jgi:hypothetical protein
VKEITKFTAAVIGAGQGNEKSFAEMQNLLRSDHPLTAEDKRALADYHDGNFKRKRGRPKQLFSDAYWLREAVKGVRDLRKKGVGRDLAIERICWLEMARRQMATGTYTEKQILEAHEKFRDKIETELHRAVKKNSST